MRAANSLSHFPLLSCDCSPYDPVLLGSGDQKTAPTAEAKARNPTLLTPVLRRSDAVAGAPAWSPIGQVVGNLVRLLVMMIS